jgi:Mrp family chromosome partitioning ATPase
MVAGDGASFVAAHLAATFAHAGHKTLLIDTDFPGNHSARFKTPAEPGFAEWMSGHPLVHCVHSTNIAGLKLMPAGGKIAGVPDKLFESRLKELAITYDRVVIDATHALAPILAACADDNLLVLRSGHHGLAEIERAAQRLSRPQVHLTGLVLNAAAQPAKT